MGQIYRLGIASILVAAFSVTLPQMASACAYCPPPGQMEQGKYDAVVAGRTSNSRKSGVWNIVDVVVVRAIEGRTWPQRITFRTSIRGCCLPPSPGPEIANGTPVVVYLMQEAGIWRAAYWSTLASAAQVDPRVALVYPPRVNGAGTRGTVYRRPSPESGKPRGATDRWVGPDDYPAQAIREKQEGKVRVLLRVGFDGRGKACTVKTSSGTPLLDSTTCRVLMRRGRWNPMQTGYGDFKEFDYPFEYRWRLPQ